MEMVTTLPLFMMRRARSSKVRTTVEDLQLAMEIYSDSEKCSHDGDEKSSDSSGDSGTAPEL